MTEFARPYQEGTSIHIRSRRTLVVSLLLLCSLSLFLLLFHPLPALVKALIFGLGLVGTIFGFGLLCKAVADGYVRVQDGGVELLMTRRFGVTARWAVPDIMDVKFNRPELFFLLTLRNQKSFWDMVKGFKVPERSVDEIAGMVAFLDSRIGSTDKSGRRKAVREELKEKFGERSILVRAFDEDSVEKERGT